MLFFPGCYQKMPKGEFLDYVRNEFERKVFGIRKGKTNVWNLDLSENLADSIVHKMCARTLEKKFIFRVSPKGTQKKGVFTLVRVKTEKQVSEARKN